MAWVKTARAPKPVRTAAPRSNTPLSSTAAATTVSQKDRNEAYFSRLGAANDARPADLHPSQGGKFAGFGSTPAPASSSGGGGGLNLEDITRDPVAALTKGWGFFTTQASRAAQLANEQVLKPLAEADLGKRAAELGQGVAGAGKAGFEGFRGFVEGPSTATGARRVEPEKKDFWESFGEPVVAEKPKPSALGTTTMKKPEAAKGAKKDDDWDNEEWGKF